MFVTTFVATINTPGYLPQADEPATFDTAAAAWAYLADERARDEDGACLDTVYLDGNSETYDELAALGEPAHWTKDEPATDWLRENGVALDGTGTVWGSTPGCDEDHDLGLYYSVDVYQP